MDTASLKGTMHTTHRSKVRWAAPGPHGVILLFTQRRVFQWREFQKLSTYYLTHFIKTAASEFAKC